MKVCVCGKGGEREEHRGRAARVARIERAEQGLVVTDLFGAVTVLDAELRSVDFIHSIVRITKGADKPCRG